MPDAISGQRPNQRLVGAGSPAERETLFGACPRTRPRIPALEFPRFLGASIAIAFPAACDHREMMYRDYRRGSAMRILIAFVFCLGAVLATTSPLPPIDGGGVAWADDKGAKKDKGKGKDKGEKKRREKAKDAAKKQENHERALARLAEERDRKIEKANAEYDRDVKKADKEGKEDKKAKKLEKAEKKRDEKISRANEKYERKLEKLEEKRGG